MYNSRALGPENVYGCVDIRVLPLSQRSGSFPLDLNTASRDELAQLPGIDPVLAERILAARPFRGLNDLHSVEGMTPEIVAGLLPHVTVRTPPSALRVPRLLSPSAPTPSEQTPAAMPYDYARRSPYSRRLYSIPVKTRYRILAGLVYGVVVLLVAVLAGWAYFAWQGGAVTPTATQAVAVLATSPMPVIESTATSTPIPPPPTETRLPSATLTLTQVVTQTTAPTAIPSGTPTPTLEPSATGTAVPTQTPTASRTPRPTRTASLTFTPRPTRTPTATATPTATLSPTPTLPAFTPPSGGEALLFAEGFDPPRYRWVMRDLEPVVSQIADGALTLRVQRTAIGYSYGTMDGARDFYYQATARIEACAPEDHYGLQVRLRDEANFYLFGVTCAGGARVQILENNRYRLLLAIPPHAAVKTGAGAVNVLAVRAIGDQFEFSVNHQPVLTLTDATLASGRFGVYARSIVTATLSVTFDDLAGWSVE